MKDKMDLLQEFIDSLTLGVYRNTPGPEGRFIIVNQALVDMFEAGSKEELMKHNVRDLYVDKSRRNELSEKILKNGFIRGKEFEALTFKGRKFTAAVTAKMRKDDDGQVYFDGIIEDISERKRTEEERARLAAIVDSSDDAIIGKTLSGVITSWNGGAEKIYGYAPEEMVGRPVSVLAVPGHGDEISRILEMVSRGKNVTHFETDRLRKDGKTIRVSLTVSPIKDSSGEIVGASTIARDITGQKFLQDELRRQMSELERFNKVAVGRELKMIELKKEIAELKMKVKEKTK